MCSWLHQFPSTAPQKQDVLGSYPWWVRSCYLCVFTAHDHPHGRKISLIKKKTPLFPLFQFSVFVYLCAVPQRPEESVESLRIATAESLRCQEWIPGPLEEQSAFFIPETPSKPHFPSCLASILSRNSLSQLPECWDYKQLCFMWVPGIWILVLMLVWKGLCPLSHLPNPVKSYPKIFMYWQRTCLVLKKYFKKSLIIE